jgi:hypothetical protein
MNVYDGAAVVNNGYFDVPISNEFSNKPQPRDIVISDTYKLNNKIANTVNNNIYEYTVYQHPTYPSPDLLIESDVNYKEYYKNKPNKHYIESFDNNNEPTKKNFLLVFILIILLCSLIFFSK